MNRLLLKLAITVMVSSLLSSAPTVAQAQHPQLPPARLPPPEEPPPAKKAARVAISQGPALELARDDLVIVGQSYGGMVVSGAADAEPSQIRALVYVDAYVPDSGDSVWSLATPRFRDVFISGAKADGLTCAPPPTPPHTL